MSAKICLITGATSGIGRAAAIELGRLGWDLWLIGRNAERGKAVVQRIEGLRAGARARFIAADVSSLQAMRDLAARVNQEVPQLDVLINNAGALFLEEGRSVDGIERTFATNHLGHFVLTLLLLDALSRAGDARVINVSSSAHRRGRGEFEDVLKAQPYDGRRSYAESKLANVLFTAELARRLDRTRITSNAVDPGGVATRFSRNNGFRAWLGHCSYFLKRWSLLTPRQGCQTVVWLATAEDVAVMKGGYFAEKRPAASSEFARKPDLGEYLWEVSLKAARILPTDLPPAWAKLANRRPEIAGRK